MTGRAREPFRPTLVTWLAYLVYASAVAIVLIMDVFGDLDVQWIRELVRIFGPLRSGHAFEPAFSNFFVLSGGIAIAFWIGTFAVLGLSRYVSPQRPERLPRVARGITGVFDTIYNNWLSLAFVNVSSCFFIAATLSMYLLIPTLTSEALSSILQGSVLILILARAVVAIHILREVAQSLSKWRDFERAFGRMARLSKRWLEAKATRQGLAAAVASSRPDTLLHYLRIMIRAMKRLARTAGALSYGLFSGRGLNPFGPPADVALGVTSLLILAPKASVAAAAVLLVMFCGVFLLLKFARTVIFIVPQALSKYE